MKLGRNITRWHILFHEKEKAILEMGLEMQNDPGFVKRPNSYGVLDYDGIVRFR